MVGMVQDAQLVMGEVVPRAFQPAKGHSLALPPCKNRHCVQQASRQTRSAGAIEHLENVVYSVSPFLCLQTGKFFGAVDGSVMTQLLNMGMFRR